LIAPGVSSSTAIPTNRPSRKPSGVLTRPFPKPIFDMEFLQILFPIIVGLITSICAHLKGYNSFFWFLGGGVSVY
jgi:hypothetical protein